jgi:hypothetical protein
MHLCRISHLPVLSSQGNVCEWLNIDHNSFPSNFAHIVLMPMTDTTSLALLGSEETEIRNGRQNGRILLLVAQCWDSEVFCSYCMEYGCSTVYWAEWCRGNTLDFCLGGSQFQFGSVSLCGSYCQSLQDNAGTVPWNRLQPFPATS